MVHICWSRDGATFLCNMYREILCLRDSKDLYRLFQEKAKERRWQRALGVNIPARMKLRCSVYSIYSRSFFFETKNESREDFLAIYVSKHTDHGKTTPGLSIHGCAAVAPPVVLAQEVCFGGGKMLVAKSTVRFAVHLLPPILRSSGMKIPKVARTKWLCDTAFSYEHFPAVTE